MAIETRGEAVSSSAPPPELLFGRLPLFEAANDDSSADPDTGAPRDLGGILVNAEDLAQARVLALETAVAAMRHEIVAAGEAAQPKPPAPRPGPPPAPTPEPPPPPPAPPPSKSSAA